MPYWFDDRIVDIDDDTEGVTVAFASGTRTRYDLLVGADGQHSQIRAAVWGGR